MNETQAKSARDLIDAVVADLNLTQAEIARHLGRSPDMVRLVRQGKRPGSNLVEALEELRQTGHVSYEHVPPRRRRKDGRLAAVRAPLGDWEPQPVATGEKPAPRPTRAPEDPKDPEQRKQHRHRFAVDRQVFRGGGRKLDLHSPRKPDAKGRKEAEEVAMRELRGVTRSQAARNRVNPETGKVRGGKVAKFYLTYENGRRIELGGKNGYQSSTALREIRKAGGFFKWLDSESKKGRNETYLGKFAGKRIVNIEMTTFYQSEQTEGTHAHKKQSIHS